MDLHAGLNVIHGDNGAGKTSILEAAAYLGLLRSIRGSQIRHLRRFGRSCFQVDARLEDTPEGEHILESRTGDERHLRVDGQPVRQASDFIRHLGPVALVPEDIELSKGGPAARRHFLDVLLAQLEPRQLPLLRDYARALRSRNELLRSTHPQAEAQRQAWDELLITLGCQLHAARQELCALLEYECRILSPLLLHEGCTLSLHLSSVLDSPQIEPAVIFAQRLHTHLERDRLLGQTSTGPHRDDLALRLNQRPLADIASEGQCRMISLILKLAAARLVARHSPATPLVLVDDVLGELDPSRRSAIIEVLRHCGQTLLATTAPIPELQPDASFRLCAGRLSLL